MALFSDGFVSRVSDLLSYEADLQSVAAATGIDLEAKLRASQTEVQVQLEASASRPGNVIVTSSSGTGSASGGSHLPRFDIAQVVVTPPLKLWHAFQTLAAIFRDANTRKLNEKYLPKLREYREMARWAADLVAQSGVGLVASPIPRPAAPTLGRAPSALPGMSLFVRITWVRDNGEEGAPSADTAIRTGSNESVTAAAPNAPSGVTGWNVYVGAEEGASQQQNADALALGEVWTMPAEGLVVGADAGDGQAAEMFRTMPRFLQRG